MTKEEMEKKIAELENEITRLNGVIDGLQIALRLSAPVQYPVYPQQPTIEPYPPTPKPWEPRPVPEWPSPIVTWYDPPIQIYCMA